MDLEKRRAERNLEGEMGQKVKTIYYKKL